MEFPKLILNKGREKSILRKHPWVFSGAVFGVSQELKDGEMVDVVDHKNNHLATGFFSDRGSIVVRIVTFGTDVFDDTFWAKKLVEAYSLRTRLLDTKATNAFRVIHGEGDGIPGLIIDFYNNNWVRKKNSVK